MKTRTRSFRAEFPCPVETLAAWHFRSGAFARLSPPWQRVETVVDPHPVAHGRSAEFRVHAGGWPWRWVARYEEVFPGQGFTDRMVLGPFGAWLHRHRFSPLGDDSCLLEDEVEWAAPGGPPGQWLLGPALEADIDRLFRFRHRQTALDLERWHLAPTAPRTILLAGGSGLLGRSLTALLRTGGHTVRNLSREPRDPSEFRWNPARGEIDRGALAGVHAVINLAGENIAEGRWTAARRQALRRSRLDSTRLLVQALTAQSGPPPVLVNASATGFYPVDTGTAYDESGPAGDGFLAQTCRDWEAAAGAARSAGSRVVLARLGVVLTPRGGALGKMLPAFRAGLGGPLGDGRQHLSWVALDDAVDVLARAALEDRYEGAINVVAGSPITQAEFAATLGRVLGRPARCRVPAGVLRGLFGPMADAALLADSQVLPGRLTALGYRHRFPGLEEALRHLLGR